MKILSEEEGKYDFSILDNVILGARKENLKLILIWFGLWKNAESMYVPSWMKKDPKKYFLIKNIYGESTNTISPLCLDAINKDADAFESLMKHIKEFDENDSTVIMMQIENEVGVLNTDRDYSLEANKHFYNSIPLDLLENNNKGTWEEIYKDKASETFMAYYFAHAIELIASRGKKEYDIPYYTNVWLKQYPYYPGSYPSGGPVIDMLNIYKKVAPSLFTIAPDIYVANVKEVIDEYSLNTNPLLIPEIRKDVNYLSHAFYSFFNKNSICYSIFGIEDLSNNINQLSSEALKALNIDEAALETYNSKHYLPVIYKLLETLEPLYLRYRGSNHLKSYIYSGEYNYGEYINFDNYDFLLSYSKVDKNKPFGSITIFELDEDTFLMMGCSCQIKTLDRPNIVKKVGILAIEEGELINGEWHNGRTLNGDEKYNINFGDIQN